MFTVIICSDILYDNCTKKYGEFLAPFLKSSDFAFCNWNSSANSLDEAVPELKNLIRDKDEWRALVVLDRELYGEANVLKRNPFNYVNASNKLKELYSAEEIYEFREYWHNLYSLAVSNPLMKLGMWLAGAPSSEYPAVPEEYDGLPEPNDDEYFMQLRRLNLSAIEVELDRLTAFKGDLLSLNFSVEGELHKKPSRIIALCERMHINENDACNSAWKIDQEHAYSRFFEDNLYSYGMRFLLSDVDYIDGKRVESSFFNFMSLVLMMACNDLSGDYLRKDRVYSVAICIDRERMSASYYTYLGKLRSTLHTLETLRQRTTSLQQEPLNNKKAEELFISDIGVSVEIPSEFDRKALMCEYNDIGLSRNCPSDEYDYWNYQYRIIQKDFIRYLREPRRAIKTSVKGEFRSFDTIDDDRAAALNEFQKEEVEIRLLDEEEAMINTHTNKLFKTGLYTNMIDEADKNIKKGISQRMTKKKTVITSCIAVAVYLFGFLPLIFGNINTTGSVLFSLLVTSIVMALFVSVGFIFLFVLRKRLINRFKHFNYVMSGILSDIDSGLERFSKYLSHACNVMREFSVLNHYDTEKSRKINILKKHEHYVLLQFQKAQSIFAGSIDTESKRITENTPFNHDYSKDEVYSYDIMSSIKPGTTMFLFTDNYVETPVDYIEAITLTREELYD